MSPVGIFGGTFDPVHYGHLRTVQHVQMELALAKVLFVLSARPPHRTPPAAEVTHRRNMLALALADYPSFTLDDRELHRAGPSYSVWTLRALRAEYGLRPLCLILGADAYAGLADWFHGDEVLTLAHIVVLPRPGWEHQLTTAAARFDEPAALTRTPAGRVVVCKAPQVNVSATAIRARVARGEDVSDALPRPVWHYIQEQQLYDFKSVSLRGDYAG